MQFGIITSTVRSVTIELDNKEVYYAPEAYDVFMDGLKVLEGVKTNVVSLYDLRPDRTYNIEVRGLTSASSHSKTFRTKVESYQLNVKKFGAIGDGQGLDSMAIQAAILACPKDGTVLIPKGIYKCAPLFLKSHMTLQFAKGAVLQGHTDRAMYPILPGYTTSTDEKEDLYLGTWEGNPLNSYASLITGIDLVNVAIIGEGVIDGNAQNSDWWESPKVKKLAWRPRTVFLKGCSNVLLQGLLVTNSPSWTLHPYLSDDLSFVDLKVINHKDSPNTDGLDPESCSNVKIIGVGFSVGDDCIAIKSGKLYMGKKLKRPSEDFSIRNCLMQHGHGAVVIGSEMSGGVKNIRVSQCLFEQTDRGLRIKTRRGRGEDGVIDQIIFDHIGMVDVLTPFVVNMFYFCDPDGKTPYVWSRQGIAVDEGTPRLGKFIFRHIQCQGSEIAAAYFAGLPEQPIETIVMEDVSVSFGPEARQGLPAMMSHIEAMKRRGIIAENVKELYLKDIKIMNHEGDQLTTSGVANIIR